MFPEITDTHWNPILEEPRLPVKKLGWRLVAERLIRQVDE